MYFYIKRFLWYIFEINCPSNFIIYAIGLLGSMSTNETWRHLITYVKFLSGVHWPTGSMYAKVVMIHLILQ